MSLGSIGLDDKLQSYLLARGVREPDVLARLRQRSDGLEMARMRSSIEQVNFLSLLLKLMGARTVLEVGVFTGYGTLGFALALPADGQVIGLDISKDYTDIGRPFWDEAGVSGKIDLRLAPAADTLAGLIKAGNAGTVDFAFIDADKEGYDGYYEACLGLLRPGGLIAIDNVLWGGSVVDADKQDADTAAIRALNEKLEGDRRVDLAMLPIGDGLTLARKR